MTQYSPVIVSFANGHLDSNRHKDIIDRYKNDYINCGENAVKQMMEDIHTLLFAITPIQSFTIKAEDGSESIHLVQGTCLDCMKGICKRKGTHT